MSFCLSQIPNILLHHYLKSLTYSHSGYKVNWTKSEALPLTLYCPKSLFQSGTFVCPKKGIRYLGLTFPPILTDLIKTIFEPLLDKLRADIEQSPLYLYMCGKANIIKICDLCSEIQLLAQKHSIILENMTDRYILID